MKRLYDSLSGYLPSFLLLVAILPSGAGHAQQETTVDTSLMMPLKVAVAGFPPVITPQGDGYLDLTLDELFARVNVDHVSVGIPATRGLRETDKGHLDVVFAPHSAVLSEYSNLLELSEPILALKYAGLYVRDDMDISTVDDFFDFRIGYLRGWKQAEILFGDYDKAEADNDLVPLIRMLSRNRIDVAFVPVVPGMFIAHEQGLDNVKQSAFHLSSELLLHVNKRHAGLLPLLKKHLSEMKEDGTYDSIMFDYMDYKGKVSSGKER